MPPPLRRTSLPIVLVLLAFLVPAAFSQSLEDQLSAGRQAYRRGDHAVALEAFRAYLVRLPDGPEHPEVRYKVARCLDGLGRRTQAASDLEDWLAVGRPDPWLVRGWLLLGDLRGQAAAPLQAEAAYTRALALTDGLPGTSGLRLEALLGRGRVRATARQMRSRRAGAEADLVAVIRQDFRGELGAAARLALGDLYLENPQVYDQAVDRAVDVWRELARVQPRSPLVPKARERCARAFGTQHRYLEAAEDLEALVRDFPTRAEGRAALGELQALRRPVLEISDPGGQRPGPPATVRLRLRNLGAVTVEAWKVDLVEAFSRVPDPEVMAREYRPSTPALARVDVPGQDPGDHSWRQQDAALELKGAGALVVRARSEGTTGSGLLIVASLVGVDPTEARGQASVWLVDADTGRGAAGVEALYASTASPASGASARVDRLCAGPTGLVDLPRAVGAGPRWLLVRRGDDHLLMPDTRPPTPARSWQAFLSPERPAYRVGDRVRWKAWVRSLGLQGPGLPAGQWFRLEVRAPGNRVLHQVRSQAGNLGTLRGDFVLPGSTPAGDCRMVLQALAQDGSPTDLAEAVFQADPNPAAQWDLTLRSRHAWRLAGEQAQLDLEVRDEQAFPVPGVLVEWTVTARPLPWAFALQPGLEWFSPPLPVGTPGAEEAVRRSGRLRTDRDGRALLTFAVPAPPVGAAGETLRVGVRALDRDGRQAHAAVEVPVGRTPLVLHAGLEGTVVPGVARDVVAQARDLLGRPARATVQVSAVAQGDTSALGTLQLDEAGRGRLSWTPRGSGPWRLELVAGQATATVLATGPQPLGAGVRVEPDRTFYLPGQVAHLQIRTPRPATEVLLLVEGSEVLRRWVVLCPTTQTGLDLPVTGDLSPGFRLRALTVSENGVHHHDVAVPVPDPGRVLQVRVRPQGIPVPGHPGRLQVQTRDWEGRAVEAEVSLALVGPDALEPSAVPSLVGAFFGSRGLPATSPVAGPVAPPSAQGRPAVARNASAPSASLETAFWSPDLRTGPEGQAEVALTWPRRAGRWVLVARAVAGGHRLGEAVVPLDLERELEIRLDGPRRLVEGDSSTYAVVLKNHGQKALGVGLRGQARGLRMEETQRLELSVPAQGEQSHDLEVSAATAGAAELEVSVQGPSGSERVLRAVPVASRGERREFVRAGGVGASARADLPAPAVGSTGRRLDIDLAPGLAGILVPATATLAAGPSSNQDLIRRLAPATLVLRGLRAQKLPIQELQTRLAGALPGTLARLRRSQKADGSWGWWPESPAEVRVTAEVCRGLLLLAPSRDAREDPAVERACTFLAARLPALGPDDRAVALEALALARRAPTRVLLALARQADRLSAAGRLHLVSALHAQGFPDLARRLLREGRGGVRHDDAAALAWWPAGGGWTEVEATALALQVLVDLEPENPLNASAAHWLCSRRHLRGWATARETALATMALARYLGRVGEKPSAFGYGIWLNGNEVETGRIEPGEWSRSRVVTLRGVQLPEGPLTLEVRKAGPGQAWWCAVQSAVETAVPGPVQDPLKVERSHFRLQASGKRVPLQEGALIRPGDRIETVVQLQAPRPLRHVTLEAPLAAGLEAPWPEPSRPGTHVESSEGSVRFWLARVPPGRLRLNWTSRARWPGQYHVPPVQVLEDDLPESRGTSNPWQLVIGREPR